MTDERTLTAAVVQLAATTDAAANRAAIGPMVARAAADGARLVVLPEAVQHDFGKPDQSLGSAAEPLDGPFVSTLVELAAEHDTVCVAGMFEATDDAEGRPYNTLVVVGPDGLRQTYRKAYLYDSFGYRESDRMLPGDGEPVVVDVDGFTVGLMTCYDLRFPEHARRVVDAGAEVVVLPAAWLRGPLKEAHWETLLTARAIENTVYVVAAGQNGRAYSGRSGIIDPMGTWLAGLGEDDGVAVARLRGDRLEQVREVNPSLANRRRLG